MHQVQLEVQSQSPHPVENVVRSWRGMTAELVHVPGNVSLNYNLSGNTNYVALHDMTMRDGETRLDEEQSVRVLDLRDRMTFLPRGCGISGWSQLTNRRHSFVALHYLSTEIESEFESRVPGDEQPNVYFEDRPIQSTLRKIQFVLAYPEMEDAIYLETLGVIAVIETHRHALRGALPNAPSSGSLSLRQERLLRDYVSDNLSKRMSLGELAALVGLSRFHFARAFKRTFGITPHRFVTACRIERAKKLLSQGGLPIGVVAELVGFGSAVQFSTAFKRATAISPLGFRRSRR